MSTLAASAVSPYPLLTPMRSADLDAVLLIENTIFPHPWSYRNFLDSLRSGYEAWVLRDADDSLLGYFLAMLVLDEVHLLNISVRADLQGQGIGRMLLNHVAALSTSRGATSILLEVRPSNQQALAVYEHCGFVRVGVRKNYYPAANNAREDAIVMRLCL